MALHRYLRSLRPDCELPDCELPSDRLSLLPLVQSLVRAPRSLDLAGLSVARSPLVQSRLGNRSFRPLVKSALSGLQGSLPAGQRFSGNILSSCHFPNTLYHFPQACRSGSGQHRFRGCRARKARKAPSCHHAVMRPSSGLQVFGQGFGHFHFGLPR